MQPTYEHSATVVAQKVLKLPAKIGDERADFFQDNLEQLQALENEARLRLLIAFLQKGNLSFSKEKTREDERPDFSFLALPSDQITLSSVKELLQELEIGNRIMAQNSMKQGVILNFEKFCESYQLDRFERLVVMLLFANSTCMEFRKMFNEYHRKGQKSSNGEMTIGELLSIISSDYREQLQHRKYFSINEKLLHEEILPHYSFSNIMSVLDLEMYLHERIVRFILGDNNVYNVSLQCVTREKPTIELERVVLPEKLKHDVVALASNYSQQLAKREALHLKEFYGYGTGLVFLFYGPSGTGKTMLAYALAHSLGKELLLLNTRDAVRNEFTFAEVIRYIFREARLTNAIAFFDECDDLILKNPSECKQFLIEIEKAECITILATNKVINLDPSLERRITMKVPFEIPNEELREKIWKVLVPNDVSLGTDVNCKTLAKKYIFTGGLIKNTLFMAISNKVKDNQNEKVTITSEEIEKAAAYQNENMYKQQGVEKMYSPQAVLDELPLKAHDKKELKALGSLIEKLQGSGTGLNVLIGSSDMKTGVDCVEAVANFCNYKVRSFSFNRIFFSSGLIKDPLTQHEISMIDYVFKPHIGYQAITLLTDYGSFFKYLLSNSQEQIDEKMFSFWDKLKTFEGILLFVTKPIKKHLIPVEFDHYIEIKHPPEELQIRQWEKHLKSASCADVEIIKLVECNPMHLHEIDFIARQATVISYSKGREGTLVLEDVQEAVVRLKSKKEVRVLFGR